MSTFKGLEDRFQPSRPSQNITTYQWSLIRWIPNRVTGEQLSVGVIIESDGFLHFQCIEDFSRIECAYGIEIADYAKNTLSMIEDFFKSKIYISISDQIIFEKKGIARGIDAKSTIEFLFNKAVPLGKPHDLDASPNSNRFATIRTSSFISDVQKYIKEKNTETYKEIFPEDSFIKVLDEENYHTLHIPIRTGNKAGSMVSTVYSTQDKLENHCLKAMNDLELALRTERFEDSVLAILIADQAALSFLEKYEVKRREDFLDDFIWKLKIKNIKYFMHNESSQSSEALLDWIGDLEESSLLIPHPSLELTPYVLESFK